MKLGHIELEASDPPASLRFFVEVLGFTLVANQNDTFIWVEKGGTEYLLRPRGDYPLPCFVYYADDPGAEADRLGKAGVTVERKGNCHHFVDGDGNSFQIVNPGDDHSG